MAVWVSRGHCGLTGLRSALEAACGQEAIGEGEQRRKGPMGGRGPCGGGGSLCGEQPQAVGRGLRATGSGGGGLEPEPEPPGHIGSAPLLSVTLRARLTPPSPGPMLAGVPGGRRGATGGGGGRSQGDGCLSSGPGAPDKGHCSREGVGLRGACWGSRSSSRVCVCPSVHGGLRTGLAPLALGAWRSPG